jgi:predicted nucleic acid-binding protein
MNVLVDTSVWVDHFRATNGHLLRLIEQDRVLGHPLVIGELACGTPPAPRKQTLGHMALLRQAQIASAAEILQLIEHEGLYGLGCGWVDMALLASTRITPAAQLWTLDKRLADLAERLGIQHRLALH